MNRQARRAAEKTLRPKLARCGENLPDELGALLFHAQACRVVGIAA